MTLLFLLTFSSPVTIAHCPDAISDALLVQLAAQSAPVSITCAERVVLVRAYDSQRLVRRATLTDEALATIIADTVHEMQKTQPEPEPELPNALSEGPVSHKVELWVEPFGTVAALTADAIAGLGAFYLKAGVTVPVTADLELVISIGALTAGNFGGSERRATEVFLSLAPVRFWHVAVGGSRSGFYLGPKFSAKVMHRDGYTYTVDYAPAAARDASLARDSDFSAGSNAFAAELGFDAGFRVQVGRANLTFALPNVSLGVTTDRALAAALPLGSGAFAYDLDFNLIRIGVSL